MKREKKPELAAAELEAYLTRHNLGGGAGWEERMKSWHRLTPWDGVECPRVVVGKRCRYTGCLCQFGGAVSNLLDHKGLWRNERKEKVFTAEPYTSSLDLDVLEGFRAETAQLGLTVRMSAASPWFPTSTVLLLVERES